MPGIRVLSNSQGHQVRWQAEPRLDPKAQALAKAQLPFGLCQGSPVKQAMATDSEREPKLLQISP